MECPAFQLVAGAPALIDGLNVMGYAETAAKADDWRAYSSLKKAAGKYPEKLLMGMPSYKAIWQESLLEENLDWVIRDPSLGLAIWDAQLKDSAWRTKETWGRISEISKKKALPPGGSYCENVRRVRANERHSGLPLTLVDPGPSQGVRTLSRVAEEEVSNSLEKGGPL